MNSVTVYPRVCGGTGARCMRCQYLYGLSPRVRGNREHVMKGIISIGSIPACAGEPGACNERHHQHRVYPRVCGGTTQFPGGVISMWGLSPRVRGNPMVKLALAGSARSIPACAGEPHI